MTPLQGALVAAAIANNGAQMRPYLIDTLQGSDLTPVVRGRTEGRRARRSRRRSPRSCATMMDGVVNSGTGTNAKIEGYEVGGKTGTAQNGDAPDHGWFIGYARSKDGQPVVAVAVLLQNAGSGGSSRGHQIAGQVMKAAIAAGKI